MSQNETSQGVCFRKEEREPSWETDLLGRKDAAHQLERLIANAPGPYVIAMTSEWGSGKTFFLKAWEKDLLARKRPCVYFNAWETDHAGDPLLALTGCITESLKANEFIAPERLKKLATTASNIFAKSPQILCKMAFGAANKAFDGALDEAKDEILDAMDLGTDLFLKNNERRADFVKQLETIAAKASGKAQKLPVDPINGTNHFPLFVMIDELDRCRPSYTIELLENIKHLFGVPGVVFLLAIDQNQIHGVIQHTFGLCDANRQNYLRKFIDVFWKLPNPDAFTFAFSNLKSKRMQPPTDWVPSLLNKACNYSKADKNKFYLLSNNEDAFYGIISQIAADSTKSLRECIQTIDRFYIIYISYKLTWRESITILSILFSPDNNIDGLREILRLRGVEVIKTHYIEQYYSSLSSIATCLILSVCFDRPMAHNPSNISNPEVYNFLDSLGVTSPQPVLNFDELYSKIQFLDNFYFNKIDIEQDNPNKTSDYNS